MRNINCWFQSVSNIFFYATKAQPILQFLKPFGIMLFFLTFAFLHILFCVVWWTEFSIMLPCCFDFKPANYKDSMRYELFIRKVQLKSELTGLTKYEFQCFVPKKYNYAQNLLMHNPSIQFALIIEQDTSKWIVVAVSQNTCQMIK